MNKLATYLLALGCFALPVWDAAAECTGEADANVLGLRWHGDGTATAFVVSTTEVSATKSGAIVYDNTTDTLKVCDGSSWVEITFETTGAACDTSTTTSGNCQLPSAPGGTSQYGICANSGSCSADCDDGSWTNISDSCS